jgi:hypothetical protein
MIRKNKHTPRLTDTLNTVALQAGLVLMTAAATLGMIEIPEHATAAIVPSQPAFAMAAAPINSGAEASHSQSANPIRREREENHPHHISYSTTQRTAPRTGRL